MTSILFLGLFIGMHHAIEADHIAAVASIAARQSSVRRIVTHGVVWGLGHTITLMVFAGAAMYLNLAVGGQLSMWLEAGVGVMLMALGGHLLYRLYRDRIHFHAIATAKTQCIFMPTPTAARSPNINPPSTTTNTPKACPTERCWSA